MRQRTSKKIIIAPQAFKGSLSAGEVACAMQEGIRRVFPDCETIMVPVADGGDDFLSVIMSQVKGSLYQESVSGILGDRIQASWGLIAGNQTAVIEVAKVLGLGLVAKDKLNPMVTCSYGLGELISRLLDLGIRKFLVGLGGSAINDAGAGMLQALGIRLLDAEGKEIERGGAALARLERIDLTGLDPRVIEAELIIGCDVTNPLLGLEGATYGYAKQKGATPEMIVELEKALTNFAYVVKRQFGKEIGQLPKGGSSGGLATGFATFLNGKLCFGIDLVLDLLHFDQIIEGADLIITGEGSFDFQTAFNKGPFGVALRARKQNIPVEAVVGVLGQDYQKALEMTGIRKIYPLESLDYSQAYQNVGNATEKLITSK